MCTNNYFYKEFRETYTFDKREHIYKTLDKAKEEFPKYSVDEYGVNVNYPNWSLEVIEWFEKWFGEKS